MTPNGRIIAPHQLQVESHNVPGPNASPVSAADASTPGTLRFISAGGLTKLEHGALLIAAGMLGELPMNGDDIIGHVALWSTKIAKAVLAECSPPTETQQIME